jgi:Flp pilus assembly protein TadD
VRSVGRAGRPAALAAVVAVLPTLGACARRPPEVTFNEHIAPIVHRSCSVCHRPGEAGPFSLLTYADVRKRARQIARVTARRYMPPWLPEPGYGDFAGSRRLSEDEIALFQQWAKEGAPEGDPARRDPLPSFPPGVWPLGPPDLVLEMSEPYTLRAEGPDDFRNFVLPVPVTGRRHVRAIDIRPGDKRIVHHANVLVDRTGACRRRDAEDPGPGFAGMDLLIESDRFEPHSHFLFWKPGTPPQVEKPGFAWDVEPGTDLVLNMHLFPSGKPERVQAAVGLYFTDDPPTEHPMLIQLENDRGLDIPPGDDDFVVTDDLVLPLDVDVLGVYPHAHYLGRDLHGFATLPDGERRELVWIKDWDLNWQGVFRYLSPLFLPRGTKLSMRYRYDNSTLNVRNPHNPPVRVRAGDRSYDEMAHLWIQVLPHGGADAGLVLQEALMRHRLERDPSEFSSHFNLAAALQSLGRREEAIAHYQRALEIEPESLTARNALGTVYVEEKRFDLAQREFERVLERAADHVQARYNLARVFVARGDLARAQRELTRILAREPDDLESLYTLGYVLAGQGRLAEATRPYEHALRLAPEDPDTESTLGQIYAMLGRLPLAERHFESALRLDPSHADAREGLARLRARRARGGGPPG